MVDETIYVSWYEHDCDYLTKYCDEYHKVGARIPLEILTQYKI
jgi:hypothetical protein